MLSTFGLWVCAEPQPHKACWAEAKHDPEVLLNPLKHSDTAELLTAWEISTVTETSLTSTHCFYIHYSRYCFQGNYPRVDA